MLGKVNNTVVSGSSSVGSWIQHVPQTRKIVPAFRRIGWGVLDQGMSSITNFAVVLYIGRILGAEQLGAFSLAYVTYGFALNTSRGLATEPLVIRFSNASLPAWRCAVANCTGTAIVTGVVCGALSIIVGALLQGTSRQAFIALGLALPVLLLQDSWRFAFFALGRGSQAFINDTIWAITLIPAILIMKWTGHSDVFWLLIAWGAGAAVAAAVGPLQARVVPRPLGTGQWIYANRDLGPRYVAENASSNVANQARVSGLSVIIGLTSIGYMQAASTLLGPYQVIMLGVSLVVVAEASRILHRSPRRFMLFCVAISIGLTLAGLLWGVALQIALPRGLGHLMLPKIWHQTLPLVLPMTIGSLGASACSGATAGLHALGASKRSMSVGVATAVIGLVLCLVGGMLGGAVGSIYLGMVASWATVIVFWVQLRRALREAQADGTRNRSRLRRTPGRHRRTAATRHRRTAATRHRRTAATLATAAYAKADGQRS